MLSNQPIHYKIPCQIVPRLWTHAAHSSLHRVVLLTVLGVTRYISNALFTFVVTK